MSEKCFIDTTVILEVILRKEFKILEKLSEYVLHTSVNVLEEASFKIIFVSVVDELSVSRVNIFKVKDSFEKGIGSSLTETRLHALNVLKDALKIIEIDEHIFDMAKKIILEYKLLPNDALIAATCKHYGIKKIATFDEDFRRLDFLEVLGL
ncbi:type II toxin-antitoxin system VapC family toxin [Archaeoglobus fulgidus]|jgi:predicted nucleic acid-binding protein|uniref:PIN domain-containing protein n=3 Tax=Archaeoglobus fulgidus TaxID=2234 RepID=O29927_ARCFU|nr:type II toxin-antitoxin system VapC family toxin [Archaeoglobus fulgidus]AAB90916.1 conserved hypothetical protein [Archaeoglobus fulgidus DSM 4304]AIG97139.1 putative nucleic acid-binding protein [Archaeoglobus fulgidus DSM 8774]KUK05317.1 MAG: putative ribonuclease VapC [Archaeoglobus fulgidus]